MECPGKWLLLIPNEYGQNDIVHYDFHKFAMEDYKFYKARGRNVQLYQNIADVED